MANVGELMFPGHVISGLKASKNVIVLGPGLRRNDQPNTMVVTRVGRLAFKSPNFYWIESKQKRYIPKVNDLVVGTIVKKGGDVFKVDIGASEHASLSAFAFEGATKRRKPDLQIGDIVYARLLSAHREMEPELICVDKYYKAGILGPLSLDGFIINVHPCVTYSLLDANNPLLRNLGKQLPYEIAVGVNGKVWINARQPEHVLKIIRTILLNNFADKQVKKPVSDAT